MPASNLSRAKATISATNASKDVVSPPNLDSNSRGILPDRVNSRQTLQNKHLGYSKKKLDARHLSAAFKEDKGFCAATLPTVSVSTIKHKHFTKKLIPSALKIISPTIKVPQLALNVFCCGINNTDFDTVTHSNVSRLENASQKNGIPNQGLIVSLIAALTGFFLSFKNRSIYDVPQLNETNYVSIQDISKLEKGNCLSDSQSIDEAKIYTEDPEPNSSFFNNDFSFVAEEVERLRFLPNSKRTASQAIERMITELS